MKKRIKIVAAVIALISLGFFLTHPVSASSNDTAYTTKNSIVFKNKHGVMQIYQVKAANLRNGNEKNFEHVIYLYGSFTNKSRKSVRPTDFFNSYFKAFQLTSSKVHELDINNVAGSPTEYTNELGNNGDDYTRPNRTVKFAVSDEFSPHFYLGQKILIKAYNYSGNRMLKQKSFRISGVYDAQVVGNGDSQHVYSYVTKASLARAKKRAAKKALKIKKAKSGSKNFYKKANQYSVYWGNNSDEYALKGFGNTMDNAYIKNVGHFYPLIMHDKQNIHLTIYLTNTSNEFINISDMLNNYFDITVPGSNEKLNFKVDDIKRYNIAKPHKESAVTLITTNKRDFSNVNELIFTVRNQYSTNKRSEQVAFAN